MKRSQFAVSWIYEELVVSRIARGRVVEHWVSPEPVPDLAAFHAALIKASATLGMHRGGDVAIAYESDDHAHVFLDLPPMQRRDLERYLDRRVEQEKVFEEDAVYSYRNVEHDDRSVGVLMHLMPSRILNAIIRICEENHVSPMRLVPLTDIMVEHLPSLSGDPNDVLLVVALFETRIEFVVATGSGEALFVRELKYHWRDEQLERLKIDIERTSLYVKQRQKNISRALVMGTEAETAVEAIAATVPFPVEVHTPASDALFWCRDVAALPNDTTTNFVPRHVQRATHIRRTLKTSTWFAYAAVLCAVVVSAWVEYLVWNQANADPELVQRIDTLLTDRDRLIVEKSEMASISTRLAALQPIHPPLPAWFLSRLDSLIPAEAALANARLELRDGQWIFELGGAATPTLAASRDTLGEIQQRLEGAPWMAVVSGQWEAQWVELLKTGRAAETGKIGFTVTGALSQR